MVGTGCTGSGTATAGIGTAIRLALLAGCVLLLRTLVARSRRKAVAAEGAVPGVRPPLTIAAAALVAIAALVPGRQGGVVASSRVPARDVNVLLLVVDAMRPDHLGPYGYERPTSSRLRIWRARTCGLRSNPAGCRRRSFPPTPSSPAAGGSPGRSGWVT